MAKQISKRATDLVIVGIDSYFGIKYNIPPIATMTSGVTGLIAAIKWESLEEKLKQFFEQLRDVTDQQRLEFHKLLGTDKEKFLRELLLTIDKLDETEKAELIGKLYKETVLLKLSHRNFRRLCIAIDRLLYMDIVFFRQMYKEDMKKPGAFNKALKGNINAGFSCEAQNLSNEGLLFQNQSVEEMGMSGYGSTPVYTVTTIGKQLLEHGFGIKTAKQ